jgi:hypothetical protein
MVKERIKSGLDLQEKMFHPSGPLGDFGNKLNLACLLGFISKDAWRELDAMRWIRNRFAHYPEINRWNIKDIEDRCSKLVLWERIIIKFKRSEKGGFSIILGESVADDEQAISFVDTLPGENVLANERYIAACKFYVAAISVAIHVNHQIQEPLF